MTWLFRLCGLYTSYRSLSRNFSPAAPRAGFADPSGRLPLRKLVLIGIGGLLWTALSSAIRTRSFPQVVDGGLKEPSPVVKLRKASDCPIGIDVACITRLHAIRNAAVCLAGH